MNNKYVVRYRMFDEKWHRVTFRTEFQTMHFIEIIFGNEWNQDVELYINNILEKHIWNWLDEMKTKYNY